MKTTYTAKYRTKKLFAKWEEFNNVEGDGFINDPIPLRYFGMSNGEIVYFPADAEVWFSAERKTSILESMSKEAGQQVVTN